MFETIIVGIEGREQDAEALALATLLGEPGAEIIAVNVAVASPVLPLRASDALELAEAVVDEFIESREGIEGSVVGAESVGRGLRAVASGARADLIVVASSRRGAVGRLLAGDAVRDVLRHAPCPVAVATVGLEAATPLRRVVVGYDGTDEAETALVEAVRLARRDGASVSVVDVVEPTIQASSITGAWLGDSIDEQYRVARAQLDRLTERFELHGVISVGRAAHELAAASAGADLLAIGLRDLGLLDRILVGSTAHALIQAQASPMLITPPAPAAGGARVADALDSIAVPGEDRLSAPG